MTPEHINRFVIDLQSLSQNGNRNISMWETQLKIKYLDYDLTDEQSKFLSEKVTVFLKNITPEEGRLKAPSNRVCPKSGSVKGGTG